MSYTVDYFFNSDKSLAELAHDFNGCLGCSLSPYASDPDDLFDRFLGMEFSLQRVEGYDNDGDMDFESFQYELSFRTAVPDVVFRAIQLPSMVMVIYVLFRRLGITGMLVSDMGILLARYEKRSVKGSGVTLYDLVSDAPYIPVEDHLQALRKRLSEKSRKIGPSA